MGLDEKLREILLNGTKTFDASKGRVFFSDDGIIAQIKKAFKESGYKQVHDFTPDVQIWEGKRLMTGQRWYDLFEKELSKKTFKFIESERDVYTIRAIAEDAARRAAGISEERVK